MAFIGAQPAFNLGSKARKCVQSWKQITLKNKSLHFEMSFAGKDSISNALDVLVCKPQKDQHK